MEFGGGAWNRVISEEIKGRVKDDILRRLGGKKVVSQSLIQEKVVSEGGWKKNCGTEGGARMRNMVS